MSNESLRLSVECQEVRELFSPFLDGEISSGKHDLLTGHLQVCEACRQEFELWKDISEALRTETFSEEPSADFCSGVISRLRKENEKEVATFTPRRLFRSWRAPAAAAAAAVMLFAGSWGINVALKDNPGNPGIVAVQPGNPGETVVNTPPETTVEPGESNVTTNPAAPVEKPKDNGAEVKPVQTPPAATGNNVNNTVLLNSNRGILSTILKISTTSPEATKDIAIRMATGLGGSGQVLSSQKKADGDLTIIRMTVSRHNGTALLAQLSGLGGILDRADEKRDITTEYTTAVNRLNEIQASLNAGIDGSQRNQLEAEASGLKRQIETWDKELNSYVVILWLE